jgi:hypothetical protein
MPFAAALLYSPLMLVAILGLDMAPPPSADEVAARGQRGRLGFTEQKMFLRCGPITQPGSLAPVPPCNCCLGLLPGTHRQFGGAIALQVRQQTGDKIYLDARTVPLPNMQDF